MYDAVQNRLGFPGFRYRSVWKGKVIRRQAECPLNAIEPVGRLAGYPVFQDARGNVRKSREPGISLRSFALFDEAFGNLRRSYLEEEQFVHQAFTLRRLPYGIVFDIGKKGDFPFYFRGALRQGFRCHRWKVTLELIRKSPYLPTYRPLSAWKSRTVGIYSSGNPSKRTMPKEIEPLSSILRPRTFDEFVGQKHLV